MDGHELIDDKVARSIRLRQISKFVLRGVTSPEAIEDATGWPAKQVAKDIERLMDQWKTEQTMNIDGHKASLVAGLGLVRSEAWEQFERSKGNAISIVKTEKPVMQEKKDGSWERVVEVEMRTTAEGRCGDPSYLSQIVNAIKQQAEILGVKVNKNANTDANGKQLYHSEMMQEAMRLAEEIGNGAEVVNVARVIKSLMESTEAKTVDSTAMVSGSGDESNVIDLSHLDDADEGSEHDEQG